MEFTTHLELQSQATRLVPRLHSDRASVGCTGVSPCNLSHSKEFEPNTDTVTANGWLTTIQQQVADSHAELFHVQSPLLMESLLVSFPLLINMLKFSR